MVSETQDVLVTGGVEIVTATGAVALDDIYGDAAAQELVDQNSLATLATLFLPIYPYGTTSFLMTHVLVAYNDTSANVDDLGDIWLLEEAATDDLTQNRRIVYHDNDVAEVALNGTGAAANILSWTALDPPVVVNLADESKLYFMTNWSTTLLNCGAAGEYFALAVKGKRMTRQESFTWRG